MSVALHVVLNSDRLRGLRATTNGRYVALCPAHSDTRPSLSIGTATDGTLLLHCFAGCSFEAIMRALGLCAHHIMDEEREKSTSAVIPMRGAHRSQRAKPVAEYEYRDENGTLQYIVERFDPKKFLQKRPDGTGAFSYTLNGVRRVPYRLPYLREAIARGETIHVVEGEKDADALSALGLAATTNAQGAGWKWPSVWSDFFKGSERVVLISDCDEPGRRAMSQRAAVLSASLTDVRALDLDPNRTDGFDISDWLEAGHTGDELVDLVERAPRFRADTTPNQAFWNGACFVRVGELLEEPDKDVEYAIDGILPAGGTGIVVAKPKVGKTTFALNMALAVARGSSFLDRKTRAGVVLYVALEGPRAQWKRLLRALGATQEDRLYLFIGRAPEGALEWLAEAVQRFSPVLIVVDTLQRFTRVRDLNDYAQVSLATEPLIELGRQSGAALLYLHHAGKGERADPGDAVLGSTAIMGSVDSAIFMKRTDRHRTISTIQRYGENLEESILEMDAQTHAVTLGGTKSDVEARSMQAAVLDYLGAQTELVDEGTIHDSVEGRKGSKVHALRELVRASRVKRFGAGKRGDPYMYGCPPNSSSLVPDICGEPQNQKLKGSLEPDRNGFLALPDQFGAH